MHLNFIKLVLIKTILMGIINVAFVYGEGKWVQKYLEMGFKLATLSAE